MLARRRHNSILLFFYSTDSCSKTWRKFMHLYMWPLAKLELSRAHTSSDHAGHIEPWPQKLLFQVLLFSLHRRQQRPDSTQQLSQDDPVLSAFANGLLWSTDDLLFVLWTIVGNSPIHVNSPISVNRWSWCFIFSRHPANEQAWTSLACF